tara:strand:- start:5840 stop:6772 length:933 start_codon:yes stop_codon:yes gene_type:complete
MKSNYGQFVLFIFTWLIFQLSYSLGQNYQNNLDKERFIASIEKRIALDIPKLTLANKKFKTAADPLSIKAYLNDVNGSLAELKSPIKVMSLQGIQLTQVSTPQPIARTLRTVDQEINLELQVIETDKLTTLNWLAPILALIITLLNYYLVKQKVAVATVEVKQEPERAPTKLQINLKNKSINFGQDNEEVLLPNKPFCFYAALVDYCMQTQLPNLKHNNEVPEELLQMANKYFYRLIELGHTKRKRPDFGANLDKTLSEIRTALDEVFKNNIEHKEAFYPPKAQGEGSRSKMHNYAIFNRDVNRVEFIGK